MPKTIVVGIGGTGFEVIRNLRKKIVEANPKQGLSAYPNLGFFYIDTDPKEMKFDAKKKKLWEVMGQDISLRDGEYVRVQAPAVGTILDNLDAYPQLKSWLPIERLQGMAMADKATEGAQQLRPLGRMIYTLCAHDVKASFLRAFGRLRDEGQESPEIYIACSISGGTGGGMFLDLGYSLRHWLAGRGSTTAFLVLPDLTLDRDRRYFANAYGALMDLNYYSQEKKVLNGRERAIRFRLASESIDMEAKPPFDDCYLIGTQNKEGVVLNLDALPEMIAHRIYLCLDHSLDTQVRALKDNAAMKRGVYLYDPLNQNQFSQNFSSFGLSSIVYPTEEIKEIVVYQILESVLKSWAEAPAVPDVNQEVHRNLSSHQLINDYLLVNKDVFGKGNNYGDIETEVDQLLDEKLKTVGVKPREANLNGVFNTFLLDFRGGMEKYYNIAEAETNKAGAADILAGNVRSYICRSLLKADLGVPFSIAYVRELINILGSKKQEYINLGSLDSKIRSSEAAKTSAIGQVTAAEGQIMFSERDARNAMVKVRQAMSIHFKAKVNKRAYGYGVLVLDLVIERLERLGEALGEWQVAVETIRQRAKRELEGVQERLKNLRENTHLINGHVLFDEKQVAEIMTAIPIEQVLAYINERIAAGGDVLEMREHVDTTLESGYRLAMSWLNDHAQQVISAKNIAQKLLERYPGANSPERAELIRVTGKKSAPFASFDQNEVNIYEDNPEARYDKTDQNARFQLAGILDSDEGRRLEVVQLREELSVSAQIAPDRIRTIIDTNQIIFISEVTAFPLRVLSALKRLKEYYQLENNQARRSLPLLISKSYDPPMGDLQLITHAQLRQSQENEETFVLGWIAGDVRLEENRAERRVEVHLKYREMGQERFARIGTNRDEAFDAWRSLDGGYEREKKLLTEMVRLRISTWTGYDERQKVGIALDQFLSELAKTVDVQSAVFQYFQDVVTRLKRKYDLYRAEPPVSPPPGPPVQLGGQIQNADDGVAIGQFRAYVADLLDRRKGFLSDGLRASIARRQKELGLNQTIAEAILRDEQSVYGKADLGPEEQYRALVSKKLTTNMILSPDDEDELLDFEVRNHISEETAQRIRAEIDAARK